MSSNPQKTHSHQPAAKELQIENGKFLPEVIKLLEEGHTVTLQLRGFSMRPFLEDNRDKALLAKAKDIQVGDAVLAETAPKHYVLHRIIKIQGETVTLRGDGNLGTEECHVNDIHGYVIGFYRKGRTKLDKTNGIKWRTYSHIWIALYPIRRYLLAAYRRIWIPLFGPI
ncbi:S24/S26 family peptidase [Hoylesella buccalis]|uniref:S24/S26 family peptidase n=1 Tax=Hoylesella buccalis TaxID=28127 RepID=UPI0039910E5E